VQCALPAPQPASSEEAPTDAELEALVQKITDQIMRHLK
jgi:hypothetical protein